MQTAEQGISDNGTYIKSLIRKYTTETPTADIDDFFQVAIFTLWKRGDRLPEDPDHRNAIIHLIIRSAARDERRRTTGKNRHRDDLGHIQVELNEEEDITDLEDVFAPTVAQIIQEAQALKSLSDTRKLMLLLRTEGYTYREIGDCLNLTEANVKNEFVNIEKGVTDRL